MAPSAIAVIETNESLTSTSPTSDKTFYLEHNGVSNTPKGLIGNALKKRVESIDYESCEPGEEDSFFVADLGEVYRQHMRWKLNLPLVKPFYGTFHVMKLVLYLLTMHSGEVQP
jgi:ornithine decarboxylase